MPRAFEILFRAGSNTCRSSAALVYAHLYMLSQFGKIASGNTAQAFRVRTQVSN